MKPSRFIGILALCAALWPLADVQAKAPGPDEVYAEVYRIRQEIEVIKRHFGVGDAAQPSSLNLPLSAGHSWQKAYEVLYKFNMLRQKHGLTFTAIPSGEPVEDPQSILVYEQARRILAEIEVFKLFFDIIEPSVPPIPVSNKTIADNYNLLNDISAQLDMLNGKAFTPSFVFAQAMRISEDVSEILKALAINDESIPPPKDAQATPPDVFAATLEVLAEIKRLKDLAGLPGLSPGDFQVHPAITPGEAFSLTGIVLAELQPLKARLGLKHALTPLARHYQNRVPGDTKQVLGWSQRRLQQVSRIGQTAEK